MHQLFEAFDRLGAMLPDQVLAVRRTKKGSFFHQLLVDFDFCSPTRPADPVRRDGHCRSAAPRTRTTGRNAKKSAAGDSGDPDPEPRPHTTNPASILSFAAFRNGGAA